MYCTGGVAMLFRLTIFLRQNCGFDLISYLRETDTTVQVGIP